MNPKQDRASGCLIGLSVGDALGTTLEFTSPGSFEPISDMTGGGPFGLRTGEWTDDTSMALRLAESTSLHGFDLKDEIERYIRWWKEGHMISTGSCFDIGNTVRGALCSYQRTGEPYSGSSDPASAGNGSIKHRNPPEIRGSGYVVQSLEAALWAFQHAENFKRGALLAVNLGEDADTTGAIYGQIAGAFHEQSVISAEWIERLACLSLIEELTDQITEHLE